jgi:hypothetical protein
MTIWLLVPGTGRGTEADPARPAVPAGVETWSGARLADGRWCVRVAGDALDPGAVTGRDDVDQPADVAAVLRDRAPEVHNDIDPDRSFQL